ncbi:MAG: hypothetical protein SGARI_005379, partial [Bacillariaceae sp.]
MNVEDSKDGAPQRQAANAQEEGSGDSSYFDRLVHENAGDDIDGDRDEEFSDGEDSSDDEEMEDYDSDEEMVTTAFGNA